MKQALGWAFFSGLALIAIDVLYYLGTGKGGELFVVGMVACCACALIGGIFERSGKLEDYITMSVALAFFGWLAFKEFF
ncbi:hypothetical protein ACYCAX_11630 [Pseudomonas sp. MT3]